MTKYTELWDGIETKILRINGGKDGEYGKDFMKIKFETDDDFPLNKPLKLRMLSEFIWSVFKKDGKLYQQIYLDGCLHKL